MSLPMWVRFSSKYAKKKLFSVSLLSVLRDRKIVYIFKLFLDERPLKVVIYGFYLNSIAFTVQDLFYFFGFPKTTDFSYLLHHVKAFHIWQ